MLKKIFQMLNDIEHKAKSGKNRTALIEGVGGLRRAYRILTKSDLLALKDEEGYVKRINSVSHGCYSLDNGVTWTRCPVRTYDHETNRGKTRSWHRYRQWPIYFYNKNGLIDIFWYSKEEYWADEILKLKKNNIDFEQAHSKMEYFRVGDEFYKRSDYFEFKGNVYDASMYTLSCGKVYEKSKVSPLHFYVSSYRYRELDAFKANVVIENIDDTKFVENSITHKDESGERVIKFSWKDSSPGSDSHLYFSMPGAFFSSMFKTNGIRYVSDGRDCFLTKKDIMDLEFAPTKAHKEIVNTVQNEFNNFVNDSNLDNETKERMLRECSFPDWLKKNITVDARFCDNVKYTQGAGVLANICKQLFTYRNGLNNTYSLDEFMSRIGILKEIFKKEKENAERKMHRQSA